MKVREKGNDFIRGVGIPNPQKVGGAEGGDRKGRPPNGVIWSEKS